MHILNSLKSDFFKLSNDNFEAFALKLFQHQSKYNLVYRQYLNHLNIDTENIKYVEHIPFLPIEFFKTHEVVTSDFEPELIFESSGTTGMDRSRHFIDNIEFYQKVAERIFESIYGPLENFHIFGLLPSYLERKNVSLAFMVEHFIHKSKSPMSGFFLNDYERLSKILDRASRDQRKILLIGVTFALLDFAEKYPVDLSGHIVMETGGMKGRREELTREEVHLILSRQFNVSNIHSEYGMTELLSQGYAVEGQHFIAPHWMRILIRDIYDPFTQLENGKTGGINVIDLANMASCAFIETKDIGKISANGAFSVLGRMDNSDLRGCNLMVV